MEYANVDEIINTYGAIESLRSRIEENVKALDEASTKIMGTLTKVFNRKSELIDRQLESPNYNDMEELLFYDKLIATAQKQMKELSEQTKREIRQLDKFPRFMPPLIINASKE